MKFIIISDIHENFHNLSIVIQYAMNHNISEGLILGDLVNPGIMHHIGKSKINFTIVLGNNDGDIYNLIKVANSYSSINLFKEYNFKKIGDYNVFLIHDNFLGQLVAKSQEFDFVFCGHDHKSIKEEFGKSILINPGELSGHMYGKSTFGVWDSESGKFNLVFIKNGWVDVERYKHDPEFIAKDVEYDSIEL